MKRENKASEIKFPAFQDALLKLQGDMTIEEFAEKIGLSRATTGFYLSGSRLPDALRLRQIADACNVSADCLIGLSDVKTRDPSLKQICDYSGLSEKAARKLHDLCNKEEYSVAHTFVDSFLCNNDIDMFEMYAAWAVLATISSSLHWKKRRSEMINLSDESEKTHIDNYHKILLERRESESTRLWNEVLGKQPAGGFIEVSNDTASHLYRDHAKNYIEEILDNALLAVEIATKDKFSIEY